MRASLEELSGQSFLYLSGGQRGQDVARDILWIEAWRPGLIAVVSDSPRTVPVGTAAECDGIPLVTVPSVYSPDAWWAMAAHGIKGVLAVGVPPDLLEESFLKAFPLGVYGFHVGLLPGMAGPAALNWALIRGLTETGTTLVRYTMDGDGWLLVSQRPCPIEDGETAGDRKSTRLNSSHSQISYAVFCLKKKITPLRQRSSHASTSPTLKTLRVLGSRENNSSINQAFTLTSHVHIYTRTRLHRLNMIYTT